ncbi:MAG: peptidyl-prolyl cis-trans isomerase [Holophagaceae bacterium]|uniref:Peptidyl-prolyl cis-trans isomerase n=1 Tax=Candidatus Geothrix skivensis TaxID=2954439 RepID=A0A9D7SI35_9BACT|nr:peptidyl-prolyl cis-trans isomerase [Candidatus Geothrix skivensis]
MRWFLLLPLLALPMACKKPVAKPQPGAAAIVEPGKSEATVDGTPKADIREEILVAVNKHIITRRSLSQAVEQQHAALYRQFSGKELDEKLKDAREKTLQGLMDAFLLEDKGTELGSPITDDYVRSNIDGIKKENNFATDADLERALKASLGIGLPEFIKRQKQQSIQQFVLQREVFSKVAVEDNELRAYYEDHKDEYRLPSRFRIRELVIAKGAGAEDQAAARKQMETIQAELKGGKPFEELARLHSTSPSKATGGDLGWMSKGFLRGSIEEAALKLKPEQVSAPIETDKDLYLVQLVALEDAPMKAFAEVKPKILEKLQEPKAQNAIEQYLSNLRMRANIRYLVPKEQILKG